MFLAFVLHRRDYGNTSLLLDILGSGQGRFPAIAKGARRPRQPASALLQPFQPLWLAVAGRGEVRTLTRVEGAGPPIPLQGRALLGGFYLNELLLRLLGRHDPQDPLFAFYQSALSRLAEDADLETRLRQFELRLLDELGYGVRLDQVAEDGAPVLADRLYTYEREHGVRHASERAAGPRLSGATLLALTNGERLADGQRREARVLLREILAPHLGARPLKSRELYQRWFGSGAIAESPQRRDPTTARPVDSEEPC
nr:DNA repair protein RecO [Thiocystis violacea]